MTDAPDAATFDALNNKFTDALKRHDFDALGAMFTDNSVMLPPGGNIVLGKANIRSFWQGRADRLQDIEFDTATVNPLGSDAVRAMGTFSMRMEGGQALLGDQAAPRETSLKYLFLWQKIDGEWKLGTLIWNRIGAPPGRGWRLGQYTAGTGTATDNGPGSGGRPRPGMMGRRGANPGKPPGFPTR